MFINYGCLTNPLGIIVASVWFEDIYGVNKFYVGIVAILIFASEITGYFTLQPLVDIYGVFRCCVLSYGSILAACISAFILWMTSVGGMPVADVIGWDELY